MEVSPEQAELLSGLMDGAKLAQERLSVAFAAIVRGHGIIEAGNPSLTGTTLTCTVADAPAV